ncbi:hypothetical protein HanIR_Chr08g0356281 [Helianthus annuus]|nr:hypothetical protein HanIR_Chr08g0356281 [Helianthus annuus]
MSLFNWHLANLEYANAGLLSRLSLAFWDQDDPYDMGGGPLFSAGWQWTVGSGFSRKCFDSIRENG